MELNSKMILLSLQKVSIGGPNYPDTPKGMIIKAPRPEMTKGNINYLKQKLYSLKLKNERTYEEILNRWDEENFENITDDVKTLLTLRNEGKYPVAELVMKSEAEEDSYKEKFYRK